MSNALFADIHKHKKDNDGEEQPKEKRIGDIRQKDYKQMHQITKNKTPGQAEVFKETDLTLGSSINQIKVIETGVDVEELRKKNIRINSTST